eukprot:m.1786 g.1786  ORF g.1786 m.1786 type:complete len:620 (+) comp7842_c0_seq1:46-1905(+)
MAKSVLIDLGDEKKFVRRRFRIPRMWNQLTRLQRSLITGLFLMMTIFLVVYAKDMSSGESGLNSSLRTSEMDAFVRIKSHEVELDHRKYEKHIAALLAENDMLKSELQRRNLSSTAHLHRRPFPARLSVESQEFPMPVGPGRPKIKRTVPSTADRSKTVGVERVRVSKERQNAVVAAFKHAWKGYKTYAWGHDELKPISKSYSEWFRLGLTIVDSLDTMWIMNLHDEFKEARDWVASQLNLNQPVNVNLFEVTIRVLGGLISAFHLSGDDIFKEKAVDLGDRLLGAFTSPSGIPYSDVNLKDRQGHAPQWGPDSSVSEVTTIQLEFRELSRMTNDPKYQRAADHVLQLIQSLHRPHNLVPIFVNANSGQFRAGSTITFGARGDSYYEYLLKQWIQSGKKETKFKDWFVAAAEGMKEKLIQTSKPDDLLYIGELLGGSRFSPKMDHLVCFMAGTLALGAHNGLDPSYMDLAEKLAYTCYQMYERTPTGLSPEIAYFQQSANGQPHSDIIIKPADAHNLLRPETVESLFILYRLTRDEKYQEWGWKIFQAFEKYTKVRDGYTSISNVMSKENPVTRNKMESFFLGETLKYLYLLFEEDFDVVSLEKYVFNTEAHPLPIWKS